MGKTLQIQLSDAQHAALSAEAQASGVTSFFGYCRSKLLAGTEIRRKPAEISLEPIAAALAAMAPTAVSTYVEQVVAPPPQPSENIPEADRLSRIEDAVARLTEFVLANHQQQPEQPQQFAPPDVDDMVERQLRQAEAEGLTEHIPDQAEVEIQHAGVRPLAKRTMPFAAQNVPRHLQDVL